MKFAIFHLVLRGPSILCVLCSSWTEKPDTAQSEGGGQVEVKATA